MKQKSDLLIVMSQEIKYGYVGKIRIEVMKITGVNFNRIATYILFSQLILVSRYIIHAGTNVNLYLS